MCQLREDWNNISILVKKFLNPLRVVHEPKTCIYVLMIYYIDEQCVAITYMCVFHNMKEGLRIGKNGESYTHTHTRVCVCVCVYVYSSTCVCVCVCVYSSTYIYVCVCVYTHTHIYMCMCVSIYTHTHTHTYTCVCVYEYTHTWDRWRSPRGGE